MAGCFLARGIPRGETEKAEAGQPSGPGGVEARPPRASRATNRGAHNQHEGERSTDGSMEAVRPRARFGEYTQGGAVLASRCAFWRGMTLMRSRDQEPSCCLDGYERPIRRSNVVAWECRRRPQGASRSPSG
jgi:hypothetical protein